MLLDHVCEHLLDSIVNDKYMIQNISLSQGLRDRLVGGIYANYTTLTMLINFHENYISERILNKIRETSPSPYKNEE